MTKCAQCGRDVDVQGYEDHEFGRCSNCDPVEVSKKKRANNREWSSSFLSSRGIDFESKNNGAHLIIKHGHIIADFWPGTGKWVDRAIGIYSRGVRKLVKHLEIETE